MTQSQDLQQRVQNLSPWQRVSLAEKLTHAQLASEQGSQQRLVAYVVPNGDGENAKDFNISSLKEELKAQLPNYMVPAAIVPLAAFPRNANGKIDVNALPVPQFSTSATDQAPRNETEATLAQIWREVLHLDTLGIHDNFFELGGDSILSIQIVSRAREAGLTLSPNQLFESPTIAELAQRTTAQVPDILATQALVTGEVPLTPIQHWFFEQKLAAPHHWHQARCVVLPQDCIAASVEDAIATLWSHHDALRLTVQADGLHQSDNRQPPRLRRINLAGLPPAEQRQVVNQHSHHLCRETQLETGLMQVAYFDRGNQPPELLITLHHLVVDAISWQILLDDLARLLQSQPLAPKTTAFKTWAEQLPQHMPTDEVDFWLTQVGGTVISLPQSPLSDTATEATAATVIVTLAENDTQALLQQVPAVYNTQINDVLLTALTQTLLEWVGLATGTVQVELETHGREGLLDNLDLSRTVGWFTTTYPLQLNLQSHDVGQALKSIKEQLRQVPRKGIGYGLLRYLGEPAIQTQLAQHTPDILFNYLGQIDKAQSSLLPEQTLDLSTLRAPHNARSYAHEINAWVTRNGLQVCWTYDRNTQSPETVRHLAQRYLHHLKVIIEHCTLSQGGFTPSDFPDVELDQSELDDFIGQLTQGGL